MRILHFADLHIGLETYGSVDPATGLSTRLIDVLRCLDEVVEYAIVNDVDLVVFCGDAYKSRDPSQTHQRELARRLRHLSDAGVPVFLLVGNHDLPNAVGRATAVEIFDTLAVSNIYVGNRPDVYRIPTKRGGVQLVALPWMRRSALLSREEAKNLSLEQVNERLQEIMTRRLWDLTQKLDSTLPTILVAHAAVATAKTGSEKSMVVGRDPVLLLGNVALPVFDYVALGHMHNRQVLADNPPLVYAGSLERFDFGDEGEEKGFYVVDIEPAGDSSRMVNYQFHQVSARRFVTIRVHVDDGDAEPTATVLREIERFGDNIRGAVVRVQISLPATMNAVIRDGELHGALKPAHHVIISREIRQGLRIRLGGWVGEGLTPLEVLKFYLETKKVPEGRQKTLLEYGEHLIRAVMATEDTT